MSYQPIGYGKSDTGLVRANNEDEFISDDQLGVYAVIDGVGGHAAGERAAAIAKEMLLLRLARQTGTIAERLREAIAVANNEIHEQSLRNLAWMGMACVLTVAVVAEGKATIGHVGDTRLYKLRQGRIEKLTPDHSPIGELEDEGSLAEVEAMRHPRRNEVYRDVGAEPHAPDDESFVEIIECTLEPEAALLLCSDGLSDLVKKEEIARIEARHRGRPDRIVEALIAAANQAGGKDNVTVVYVAERRGLRAGFKPMEPAPLVRDEGGTRPLAIEAPIKRTVAARQTLVIPIPKPAARRSFQSRLSGWLAAGAMLLLDGLATFHRR
ncbi:MAG: PP2C family protein-serine/threonine phosphatase [Blastocatellia bacterium]